MASRTAVVIGGGVIGVSTAYHLARDGVDVVLVTQRHLADGASGRSLSWLNSAGTRSPEYHRLRTLGLDRYRTMAARSDVARFLRFDGGVRWATDTAPMREAFAHELSIGYDSMWLTRREVAAWTPGIEESAIAEDGAVFNPGEGWVHVPSLIRHLSAQLQRLGGKVLSAAGACDVAAEGGRAVGVTTEDGTLHRADAVLVATGSQVPEQLARLGVVIPAASSVAMLVTTAPADTAVTAVLNTPRVSLRPDPGGGLAMDSAWSEESLGTDADGTPSVPDGVVDELLVEASRVLAGTPRLEVESIGVGAKPIPADGEPVLGAVGGVPGLFVAFTHSGATLALIAGELLSRAMTTGATPSLLLPYRPERFVETPPVGADGRVDDTMLTG